MKNLVSPGRIVHRSPVPGPQDRADRPRADERAKPRGIRVHAPRTVAKGARRIGVRARQAVPAPALQRRGVLLVREPLHRMRVLRQVLPARHHQDSYRPRQDRLAGGRQVLPGGVRHRHRALYVLRAVRGGLPLRRAAHGQRLRRGAVPPRRSCHRQGEAGSLSQATEPLVQAAARRPEPTTTRSKATRPTGARCTGTKNRRWAIKKLDGAKGDAAPE